GDNIAGRAKFQGARSLPAWTERGRLPVVRGDLDDELLEDGIGERFVVLRGDHEGAGAADHAVVVIAVEIGLEGEDRQAVDADAGRHRLVAGERDRAAAIVGAVAGDIDDAPARAKWAVWKQRRRVIDGAADRGAAARQLGRRRVGGGDGRSRGQTRRRFPRYRPASIPPPEPAASARSTAPWSRRSPGSVRSGWLAARAHAGRRRRSRAFAVRSGSDRRCRTHRPRARAADRRPFG